MTPLDSALAILLFALVAHIGIIFVTLVRALVLDRRRHPQRRLGVAAGAAALGGELLAVGALIGRTPPLPWIAGLLGLGLILGLAGRSGWREHVGGRAAFHAVVAAPLVALLMAILAIR